MLFYSFTPKISFNLIFLTICYTTLLIFFVLRSWQDKKKHLSLFLLITAYHLSYFYLQTLCYQHCWSQQYAGHMSYEFCNRPCSPWSLCGSEVECRIQSSEVRFFMGTQNFFFVPCSWQDKKHLSQTLLILVWRIWWWIN